MKELKADPFRVVQWRQYSPVESGEGIESQVDATAYSELIACGIR